MFEKDTREGYNHPHWDHSGTSAPSRHWRSPQLECWLRRAGLPVHPGAPLALMALGLGHCLLIAALFAGVGGPRPLAVASVTFGSVALLPGIGLLLTGAWELTRPLLRRLRTG